MPDPSTRPKKPNMLMFSSKGLKAKAKASSIAFGTASNGSIQVALDFEILPADDGGPQRAQIYSVPEGGPQQENTLGPVPPGTLVRLYGSFSGGAKEYTIDKLRSAGWNGSSLKALSQGQYDGLGESECRVAVEIDETDKDGNWRMTGEGDRQRFAPRMQVTFVNRAGAAFKEAASVDQLAELDKSLGDMLKPGAPGPKRGSSASNPAGAAPAAGNSDDLPF